jgi:hypothetical protein
LLCLFDRGSSMKGILKKHGGAKKTTTPKKVTFAREKLLSVAKLFI